MAYKHEQVMQAQHEVLTNARAAAVARYEAARGVEDDAETMDAADRILDCDAKLAALGRIAQNHVAGTQAAQPQSRYGLSPEEQSIAHASFVDRKDMDPMSLEERERVYAIQKNKLRAMKANGTYSDQKG
jgi:hypothetical protein